MSDLPENNENREIAGQITYPVGGANDPIQPRPARNLQDLLRYSTEVRARAGGAPPENLQPMDEESRRFLNEALASMTTDVIEQLKNGIETIENLLKSDEILDEDCDAAFDNILELVDKIDFANDFHKIGGFRVFNPCLNCHFGLVRWRCCELIAELCQNNPYCQEKCLKENYLPKLLCLIDKDPDNIVRIKALYAVSCLVRESKEALRDFTSLEGFSVLLRCLQSDNDKLKIKSSFLLSSLCAQSPYVKDELVKMGFVEQLLGLIIENKDNLSIVEHMLSALLALVDENPAAKEICLRPDLKLKSLLDFIVDSAQTHEETREVVEYAKALITNIFDEDENSMQEDR